MQGLWACGDRHGRLWERCHLALPWEPLHQVARLMWMVSWGC